VGESCETLQTHADGGVTSPGTMWVPWREYWASHPSLPSFANSDVVGGKYKLLRPLGRGGMGRVWAAEHTTLRVPVALKFMSPAALQSREARARFALEAHAAAELRSSHVVQVLDYGTSYGAPYIAMELLEGETLAARLARSGALSPRDTASVLEQVARAMVRAHARGVVHRDLKPDNIFLVREDGREIVKVLDFGVARYFGVAAASDGTPTLDSAGEVQARTEAGLLVGTPCYLSPEQADGELDVDYRSDLWAMGVIAFECLTGKRPFEHRTLGGVLLNICVKPIPVPSRLAAVPTGFDRWFAKAVARSPGERFDSATALAAALTRLVGDWGSEVERTARSSGARSKAQHARRPGVHVAIVAFVLALVCTALAFGPWVL